ncbi:ribosomal protein L34 [Ochrobactrum sp. RC6B]|nr:hypothetical protein [Ochrobactrum sp. RC6B]MBB3219035.1 ribosomal protein L34 [Ochrobactrum sp. RC6B]
MARLSRIPKSAKRFSDQDARENKSHPEKCEAVFGSRCARKQSRIPKSAKRFSDQDARENKVASRKVRSGFRIRMREKTKSHPEKYEAVFGPGCARKQSGIPKSAKRFSDQDARENKVASRKVRSGFRIRMRVKGGGCAWRRCFAFHLFFSTGFNLGTKFP